MSTPNLVLAFYERIWNAGDIDASSALLAQDFSFRGSLGPEMLGREAFRDYVRMVRTALDGYRCDILDCVTEGDRAFAKMHFSGIHVGPFRGYAPTGKPVQWLGAALFRVRGSLISELWVLGDLFSLEADLKKAAASPYEKSQQTRADPLAEAIEEANTAKVATILLCLRIENNSKWVRGKKRSIEDIERYCLEEYNATQRPDGDYELQVPFSSDEELDETMNELLGNIASQADDRHCFSESDARMVGTDRHW